MKNNNKIEILTECEELQSDIFESIQDSNFDIFDVMEKIDEISNKCFIAGYSEKTKEVTKEVSNLKEKILSDSHSKNKDLSGFVYLIMSKDGYKIGRSIDVKKRFSSLKLLSPSVITLV